MIYPTYYKLHTTDQFELYISVTLSNPLLCMHSMHVDRGAVILPAILDRQRHSRPEAQLPCPALAHLVVTGVDRPPQLHLKRAIIIITTINSPTLLRIEQGQSALQSHSIAFLKCALRRLHTHYQILSVTPPHHELSRHLNPSITLVHYPGHDRASCMTLLAALAESSSHMYESEVKQLDWIIELSSASWSEVIRWVRRDIHTEYIRCSEYGVRIRFTGLCHVLCCSCSESLLSWIVAVIAFSCFYSYFWFLILVSFSSSPVLCFSIFFCFCSCGCSSSSTCISCSSLHHSFKIIAINPLSSPLSPPYLEANSCRRRQLGVHDRLVEHRNRRAADRPNVNGKSALTHEMTYNCRLAPNLNRLDLLDIIQRHFSIT